MTSRATARAAAICTVGILPKVLHAATPHLGGGGDIDVSLGRIVIAFLICIIVAVLAILLIRHRRGKIDWAQLFKRFEARAREIQVIETRRLNTHSDICLVRHDDHEYLLVLQLGSTHVLRQRELSAVEQRL